MGNLEKPIKKMLDITPGKGAKANALSKRVTVAHERVGTKFSGSTSVDSSRKPGETNSKMRWTNHMKGKEVTNPSYRDYGSPKKPNK